MKGIFEELCRKGREFYGRFENKDEDVELVEGLIKRVKKVKEMEDKRK